jgi:arginyl-tRNA synthetase
MLRHNVFGRVDSLEPTLRSTSSDHASSKRSNRKLVALASVLQQFNEQCLKALEDALKKTYPGWANNIPRLAMPPSLEFGELSSSIAYEIARANRLKPQEVAETISKELTLKEGSLVAVANPVSGYINFKLEYRTASGLILSTALREDRDYGTGKATVPIRVSVEHTSANPSGPLTMGHARNAILGDTLARLLKARGHSVNRRFYVDDVGRQVSILAYGFKLLKGPEPKGKVDHWLGRLYACTNCALQIEATKKKLEHLSSSPELSEERSELQRSLDEWVGIAAELASHDSELLKQVVDAVKLQADPEAAVQEIGRSYEKNDLGTVRLVRAVANLCLEGITATLGDMDIGFDTWDWEGQIVWEGHVEKTLARLRKLPFTRIEDTSASLDVNAIVDAYSLREAFKLSDNYEVPPLTLIRSDGTTLYSTRDIAYSLVKFADSDMVINVIASEQTLPQLQIRLALYALGEKKAAQNLVHYSYGLVELPGVKMSKRRAHYITLDDVVQQAYARVREAMAERKEELGKDESEAVIRAITLGAIKFAMLSVDSAKNLLFTWDRVLSLERNSAPFINYAYTRAGSILRKLGETPKDADFTLLTHPLEQLLILKIGQLPEVFLEAADQLKPEELANYANTVAEKFHEYYEKVDVIHAKEEVKNARALLVRAIQIVLRNSMELLGIKVSERM